MRWQVLNRPFEGQQAVVDERTNIVAARIGSEKNANLIAAAPELLDILKHAVAPCARCEGVGRLDSHGGGDHDCWTCGAIGFEATPAISWGDIKAVIAKAEGC